MKRMALLLAMLATSMLVAASCGGSSTSRKGDDTAVLGAAEHPAVLVKLGEVVGSGVTGTVKLSGAGNDQTKVHIALTGDDGSSHPAHLHQGTCSKPNPVPRYPLNNVKEGTSDTTIDADLDQLESEAPLYVNVHKSGSNLNTSIACKEIDFS